MKRPLHQPDDSWENDAVWKLLDHAPPPAASPRFVDDAVRAARLAGQAHSPWWKRLLQPLPLAAGLTAAVAAVTLLAMLPKHQPAPVSGAGIEESQASQFAAIQEIADAELLSSAADQPDDFSDLELVSLIGF